MAGDSLTDLPRPLASAQSPMYNSLRGSAIFSEQAWKEITRSLRLSERELQIVRGVFDDSTESAISAELGISSHTVHTHVERLHRKLAVTDRGQLILHVVQAFLALTSTPGSGMPPVCAARTAGGCPLRPG
jgi:DNA-binding NarL/FixJ family response regulator